MFGFATAPRTTRRLQSTTTSTSDASHSNDGTSPLGPGEWQLLRDIFQSSNPQRNRGLERAVRPVKSVGSTPLLSPEEDPDPLPKDPLHELEVLATARPARDRSTGGTRAPDAPYDRDGLTRALRHPTTALEYLNGLVLEARKSTDEWRDLQPTSTIAAIPALSFSELLRQLDPLTSLSKEVDPTAGLFVGPGLSRLTPIGSLMDTWGTRKLYRGALDLALTAVRLRMAAGQRLLPSDFRVLLRLVGAIADYPRCWEILHLKRAMGAVWGDDLWTEFLRVQYLADDLYMQFDFSRHRVRPMDKHKRSKKWIDYDLHRHYLRRLSHNIISRQPHRYQQNSSLPDKVELLTREVRKQLIADRALRRMEAGRWELTEETVCTLIMAYARSGRLQTLEKGILRRIYGIRVRTGQTGLKHVDVTPYRFHEDHPVRPTGRLLDAIVRSYGMSSNLMAGLKIMEATAHAYRIPIPDRTWLALFNWAYINCAKPISQEWKLLRRQFPARWTPAHAPSRIWDMMTRYPYYVKPGFNEHCTYIKHLISVRNTDKALELLIALKPAYDEYLAELERAFAKHALNLTLGVQLPKVEKAWLDARVRKLTAVYNFQYMVRDLLIWATKPTAVNHTTCYVTIPNIIDMFRHVLPGNIKYRTMQGVVEIHGAQPISRLREAKLEIPGKPLKSWDNRIHSFETNLDRKAKPRYVWGRVPSPHMSPEDFVKGHMPWPLVQREFR